MYVLARANLELAQQLGSHALWTDAIESIACGWLALVVVAALAAQLLFSAWWVDATASLAIVYFLFREGREAWKGEECRNCRSGATDPPLSSPGWLCCVRAAWADGV
jgi:hypothetical protein